MVLWRSSFEIDVHCKDFEKKMKFPLILSNYAADREAFDSSKTFLFIFVHVYKIWGQSFWIYYCKLWMSAIWLKKKIFYCRSFSELLLFCANLNRSGSVQTYLQIRLRAGSGRNKNKTFWCIPSFESGKKIIQSFFGPLEISLHFNYYQLNDSQHRS